MKKDVHTILSAAAGAAAVAAIALVGARGPAGTPVVVPSALIAPLLPNSALTPGAMLPVSMAQVCVPGYSKGARKVPAAEKAAVYKEYGIVTHAAGDYEIDHLISLELGGSNDIKNLWPESYRTQPWNAHVKDRYEDWLHHQVCQGAMSLLDAQDRISHDWITHYQKDLGPVAPEAEGEK